MRFVWAVAAFVVAAMLIGAGIAQRTVLQGPDTTEASVEVADEAPYLLIDGAVLGANPGTQTLRAQAEGEIFAAYGRTTDLQAWLSDQTYNRVTLGRDGEPTTRMVEPEQADAGSETSAPTVDGEEATAAPEEAADEAPEPRDPVGSDLWLDEFQQADVLIAPLQLPDDMSVLVAADGAEPAPSAVTISWPIDNSTPWAGPLFAAGGLFLAIGVFLYILGIRHVRKSRGPRRKGLPVPVTEPIDVAVDSADKGVIAATPPTRRALERGRRRFAIVPAVAVSALLFAGCSADSWPQVTGSATPSPTASVIVPEGQQAPAVTRPQAEKILSRIGEAAAQADEEMDADLAATRLGGPVLAARETNYTLRGSVADHPAPSPIATNPVEIVLPQAYDGWPRSVMAVVDDTETKTSSIMIMTQQDAWAPYKLTYQASLEADTLMPDLAAPYVGAPRIAPDSPFLILPPDELATAYADLVDQGDDSEYAALFEAEGDQFRASIAADRQARLDAFNQTATNTGSLTFEARPGDEEPFAIGTLESGAIVAVTIDEVDTVKPTNEEAVIKLDGNPTVSTLAGAEQSSTGFTTTYTDQLFFYVPAQGSTEKIRLLGYGSAILDAKVIS